MTARSKILSSIDSLLDYLAEYDDKKRNMDCKNVPTMVRSCVYYTYMHCQCNSLHQGIVFNA